MLVNKLIIHCSATKPSMKVTVKDIDGWHRARGWSGIGYHWYIDREGCVHGGRDTNRDGNYENDIGAHTYGFNRGSLSVCMEGGVDEQNQPEDNFTDAQWDALKLQIIDIQGRHRLNLVEVYGHNDFDKNKACPSFNVREKMKELFL